MRAWMYDELGEPQDVLRLRDLDPPEPAAGQVVVEVEAVGLNFPDLLRMRGGHQIRAVLPAVPGAEFAGRIRHADPNGGVAVGSRVLGFAFPPDGTLAESIRIPAVNIVEIPQELTATTAVALPANYYTAFTALHVRAGLRPDDIVLVHGGAGGVGSAAIQLALAAGARVLATDRGANRLALCREIGAELAVDPEVEDFADAVKSHTEGHGADLVVDTVGGDVFDRTRRCIAFEGRVVVVGFISGRIPELPVNHLILRNFSVIGVDASAYGARRRDVHDATYKRLIELGVSGSIRPVISVFGFEQAQEALTMLGEGQILGKAVIQVG
jgi:NADPH2:quinone reductase